MTSNYNSWNYILNNPVVTWEDNSWNYILNNPITSNRVENNYNKPWNWTCLSVYTDVMRDVYKQKLF